jgi:O-antigen ligase
MIGESVNSMRAIDGPSLIDTEGPNAGKLPSTGRAKWAYFFLLLFTTLLFARPEDYLPILASGLHLALIVGACAGITYLLALFLGKAPLIWTPELKWFLALTAWFVIGIPFAQWRSNSIGMFAQYWLKTFSIFFLITQTLVSVERIFRMLWVIIGCQFLVTSLSVLFQGHQVAHEADRLTGVAGGFFSGNFLGIAAGMTFPYMVVFLLNRRAFFKSIFLLLTLGFTMWMLVLTASRSGFLTLLVSFILTWLFILRKLPAGRLFIALFILLLIGATVFAPAIFWSRLGTLWSSSDTTLNSEAVSANESEALRRQALDNSIVFTFQHPIFGLGMGNFASANGTAAGNPYAWIGTHNMFTEVSSEGGIPALLLFVGILWVAIRDMHRIGRIEGDSPPQTDLKLMAKATLVGTSAFAFGGFFAHIAYDFYLFYMVGLAACLQAIARQTDLAEGNSAENGLPGTVLLPTGHSF